MTQLDIKSPPERAGRLSADDWSQAALDLIAEQGINAVAVEPLARRLGVTKGSFYWHFPSREALLVAALERWELDEKAAYGGLESIADAPLRLRALFQLISHHYKTHIIYSELLKAPEHPVVNPVIGRVSQRRLDFLRAAFSQAGLSPTEAGHRARMVYASYIGFLQLELAQQHSRHLPDEFEAYIDHMMRTLIPA